MNDKYICKVLVKLQVHFGLFGSDSGSSTQLFHSRILILVFEKCKLKDRVPIKTYIKKFQNKYLFF